MKSKLSDEELTKIATEYASSHDLDHLDVYDKHLYVNCLAHGFFMGWRRSEVIQTKFFKSYNLNKEAEQATRFYFEKKGTPLGEQKKADLLLIRGFKVGFIEHEMFNS